MSLLLTGSAVLDSSVILKWFRAHEVLREQALWIRQAYLDGNLRVYAPDLLIYEIANVLRYKPDMDPRKVQQAIGSLFDMGIGIVPPSERLMARAVEIAYSHKVTIYDAVFSALAERLNAPFVTADEKLAEKLRKLDYVHFLGEVSR